MRRYNVAVAALAIEVDHKWVDNVLSHFSLRGVEQSRQGRSRRLDREAIVRLALILWLARSFGIPVRRGIEVSLVLLEKGAAAYGEFRLSCDIESIRARLTARLAEAVEMSIAPVRGRPRQR